MSCSNSDKNRGGGEEGEQQQRQHILRRSVQKESTTVVKNGSITAPQLTIDESLLVDPKLLFIGSKIGEGAHGKVYEGRSVSILLLWFKLVLFLCVDNKRFFLFLLIYVIE